jgi:hypothetical protein
MTKTNTTRTVVSRSEKKIWSSPQEPAVKLYTDMVVYHISTAQGRQSLTRFEKSEKQEAKKAA